MKITAQVRATELDVGLAGRQIGDEIEITGTARVVGMQEELGLYGDREPELLVTLALEVRLDVRPA